jgi:DNA mismatch endonuclease (patch repair protein)
MRESHIGKRLSIATRIKMSVAHLGKRPSDEARAKLSKRSLGNTYFLGHRHSEKTKAKMRERIVSVETRAKLRAVGLGHGVSEETRIKIKKAVVGRVPSMLGKHHSAEAVIRMRKAHDGIRPTEEARLKMRRAWSRRKASGWVVSDETKARMRAARVRLVTPFRDTRCEVKIQTLLKELDTPFEKHRYIFIEHGYQCDLFLPDRALVIECDGCYWHSCPICYQNNQYEPKRRLDSIRTQELLAAGYGVLRLWEHEINKMTAEDLRQRIEQQIRPTVALQAAGAE